MKSKLIKQFENDTDFSICVFQMENGQYVVTEYDFVDKKHQVKGKFNNETEALMTAKKLNNSFKETKQQIHINERKLQKIIKESVKKVLKESTFSLSPNEIRELVASAKEYESGDMEIWAEENCPDEIYPNDYNTCLKIWLKAHKEDIPYYQ